MEVKNMEKQQAIDIMDELIGEAEATADFQNPLNCYLKSIAIGIRYLVEKL